MCIRDSLRAAQNVLKEKIAEINSPIYMIENGDIEGLKKAAAADAEGLPLQIAKQLKLYDEETVGTMMFKKTQMTQKTKEFVAGITVALQSLSNETIKNEAMKTLQTFMEKGALPKDPVLVDTAIATSIANGSPDVVSTDPVQKPVVPSLNAAQLQVIVGGQNAAQELAKQALNKDILTVDDNALVESFGALVTQLGLVGADQAQVLGGINKLIADTRMG